jgi:hypothetical protein
LEFLWCSINQDHGFFPLWVSSTQFPNKSTAKTCSWTLIFLTNQGHGFCFHFFFRVDPQFAPSPQQESTIKNCWNFVCLREELIVEFIYFSILVSFEYGIFLVANWSY